LSVKGGVVWQFYYSFCQRQLADETISFCVPRNSHLKFYICITQAFEKMPSHTFACSVEQTATAAWGDLVQPLCSIGAASAFQTVGQSAPQGKHREVVSLVISVKQFNLFMNRLMKPAGLLLS